MLSNASNYSTKPTHIYLYLFSYLTYQHAKDTVGVMIQRKADKHAAQQHTIVMEICMLYRIVL